MIKMTLIDHLALIQGTPCVQELKLNPQQPEEIQDLDSGTRGHRILNPLGRQVLWP